MGEITRNPLCWPDNVARTLPYNRRRPLFAEKSITTAVDLLLSEINRLNHRYFRYSDPNVIISTNLKLRKDGLPAGDQGEPKDTGAAIYFQLFFRRNGKEFNRPIVLSCDRWNKVAWNIYAIAKDIEAQRARDRWGATNIEQAFRGYLAIPEKCGGPAWWELLGIKPEADAATIKSAYREKAAHAHPDKGGSQLLFAQLQEAYDQALAKFK